MNILFLERYNNYANRIIKKDKIYIEDILAQQASENKNTFILQNINFNPNDGITTTFIVGSTLEVSYPDWIPDYCIVYDPNAAITGGAGKYTPFSSCWFILESKRLRGNQYELTLKRDVIRDNYDTIKTSDIYVEKGTLQDSDSFIFNPENVNVNQIKESETLLKDATGIQWLVGYVVQDRTTHENLSAVYSVPPSGAILQKSAIPASILNYMDFENGEKTTNFLANYDNANNIEIFYKVVHGIWTAFVLNDYYASVKTNANSGGWSWNSEGTGTSSSGYRAAARLTSEQQMMYDINSWPGWTGVNYFSDYIYQNREYLNSNFRIDMNLENYTNYIALLKYNNKLIYDATNGKYYRITIDELANEPISKEYTFSTISNTRAKVRECFMLASDSSTQENNHFEYDDNTSSNEKYFKFTGNYLNIRVRVSEQGSNTIHWTISERRKQLIKEPYDMFCIPYGNFTTRDFTVSQEASIAACRAIAAAGIGSSNALVYDIQLLPYCPLQSVITSNHFNEYLMTEHEDYEYIYGPNNQKLSIAYWCTESEFTFDIPCPINVLNPKEEACLDLYRLCSPNYAGLFEFNVAKNGGLSYFNVDCSYKPFQPYIHINPDFGGLYGSDFNDSRGLICGGDFSLAIATNAWEQYKLNNKNYQAIFDRDIQKLDEDYNVQEERIATNMLFNTIGGAAGGAGAGAMGGWIGAIVGALAGGGLAIAKGGVDLALAEEQYNVNRQYNTDMFNLKNGNVKALPNSLAKTDPFTFNNKKWPFLEKYTCTPEEKEAFRQKIKFNGMTVGRIGKLIDYISPVEMRFFKGQLIRDNFIIEDSHTVDAIYSELAKGVYL